MIIASGIVLNLLADPSAGVLGAVGDSPAWFANFFDIYLAIPYRVPLMDVLGHPMWLAMILAYGPPLLGLVLFEILTGATPGKKLFRLRIARSDGAAVSRRGLLARGLLKYSPVLLTALSAACMLTWLPLVDYKISLAWLSDVDRLELPLRWAGRAAMAVLGVGFLLAALPSRRALHDRLCGTAVFPAASLLGSGPKGFEVAAAGHAPTHAEHTQVLAYGR